MRSTCIYDYFSIIFFKLIVIWYNDTFYVVFYKILEHEKVFYFYKILWDFYNPETYTWYYLTFFLWRQMFINPTFIPYTYLIQETWCMFSLN